MARQFNGTTDVARTISPVGIQLTQISISLWMLVPAYTNPTYGCALTYDQPGAVQHGCFLFLPSSNVVGLGALGFSDDNLFINYWTDYFPQASAGAWHHYLYVIDRLAPSNKLWIDGVAQALIPQFHNPAAYGQFKTFGDFYFGAESAAAVNPQACTICEVGMFDSQYGQNQATSLAAGASIADMPWDLVATYYPLGGYLSPEPRWVGPNPVPPPGNVPVNLFLTGTTAARNPAVVGATVGRRLAF